MFDPVSLGLTIGGNVIGGVLGSNSARRAAETQRRSAAEARGVLGQSRQDWAPYADLGATGARQLQGQLPDLTRRFTAQDFTKDPGYDFRLREGQNVLEGSAAARGRLFSGAAGKALTQYGQNFASNEYDKAYGRFTNDQNSAYNRLMGLVGVGTQAAGANQRTNEGMAGLITGAGNAQAAGQIGSGNAWAGAISGGLDAWQDDRAMQLVDERNQLARRIYAGGNLSNPVASYYGYGR